MYTSNQMPDTEEVKLIIMAVELEDAEKLIFSLEEGYRLISVNAAHICDDEIDVADGRIYELQKSGKSILSFSVIWTFVPSLLKEILDTL